MPLKKGSKGVAVKVLQTALISLGYNLPRYGADGDYGNETETAVKAFQVAHSLPVGDWDEECQEVLEERMAIVDEPNNDALWDELDAHAVRDAEIRRILRKG
jgi:peptidoglycan hydrolase-like protein with peptidoglycan-binding domain